MRTDIDRESKIASICVQGCRARGAEPPLVDAKIGKFLCYCFSQNFVQEPPLLFCKHYTNACVVIKLSFILEHGNR